MTQTLTGLLTDRYGKNLNSMDASHTIALLPAAVAGLGNLPPWEPRQVHQFDVDRISGGAIARLALVRKLVDRAGLELPETAPFDVVDRVARVIYVAHIGLLPGTPLLFDDLSEYERSRWIASAQAAIVALE
jgi:hypothetical protein